MEIFNCKYDLSYYLSCLSLLQTLTLFEVTFQIGAWTVFQNHTYSALKFKVINKFDDIGVVELFVGLDLSFEMFHQYIVLYLGVSGVRKAHLDCYVVFWFDVHSFVDLAKTSVSDEFKRNVSMFDYFPVIFGNLWIFLFLV